MNQETNSPLRYPGGKFHARKLIIEHIPKHTCYVEPFAGGASIFFAKSKAKETWLNDVDAELINCLEIIRDYPDALAKRLEGEEVLKERHTYYKTVYKPETRLDRAARWFYINRTSYSGIMREQNCYFTSYRKRHHMRPENWPRRILQASEKLHGVKLTTFDFEKVLTRVPDGAFLFVDPPYFIASQERLYAHSLKKEDHFRLCASLKRHSKRFKFLLTYNDSPEIRDLYSWAPEMLQKEWPYMLGRMDYRKSETTKKGERRKGKELFIMNYTSPARLFP